MHPYIQRAHAVINTEIQALNRVGSSLGNDFIKAVDSLLECLKNKGKIVVVGVGKSGNICHKLAATLNSTGATSVVLDSQNALHGDLGLLSEDDIVIAMSYSGETAELVKLLPFFKKLDVSIIALTSKPDSTLGKHADAVLDSSVEKEACPLNLAPTSSSTAMLALGDALAMTLLEARGFTKEDFARFHPGGALGESLLTTVKDIMRNKEQSAFISPKTTILEGLEKMSRKKAGVCVVAESNKLLGVMTHGDFIRHYTKNHDIDKLFVEEIMTKNPITIREDVLAAEAISVFRAHLIDDIIVVNDQGTPTGVIDSQDITKHKLI